MCSNGSKFDPSVFLPIPLTREDVISHFMNGGSRSVSFNKLFSTKGGAMKE